MRIVNAQITVGKDPEENLRQVREAVEYSLEHNARLVLLPEGLISRDPDDPDATAAGAQAIDGPFVQELKALSTKGVAIAASIHIVQEGKDTVKNLGVVFDNGECIHTYEKLHPYDAFHARESDNVEPGNQAPGTFEIDGVTFGLLICYDVRFPEASRDLALQGADVILLPAAWVRGSLKEQHWCTMVQARALENTLYVVANGEISNRNCGLSMTVDPLGVIVNSAAEEPEYLVTDIHLDRIHRARRSLPVLENRRYTAPTLRTDK
jgi:predicted amidohydrolase